MLGYCTLAIYAKTVLSRFILQRLNEYQIRPKLGNNHFQRISIIIAQPLITIFLFDVSKPIIQKGKYYKI
jgi:hypothetical protein